MPAPKFPDLVGARAQLLCIILPFVYQVLTILNSYSTESGRVSIQPQP